jgi:hypothetical protein
MFVSQRLRMNGVSLYCTCASDAWPVNDHGIPYLSISTGDKLVRTEDEPGLYGNRGFNPGSVTMYFGISDSGGLTEQRFNRPDGEDECEYKLRDSYFVNKIDQCGFERNQLLIKFIVLRELDVGVVQPETERLEMIPGRLPQLGENRFVSRKEVRSGHIHSRLLDKNLFANPFAEASIRDEEFQR